MCLTCGKVLRGAVGVSKAVAQMAGINVDRAPDEVVATRRDACRDCEHSTKNPQRIHLPTKGLTKSSRCQKCSCVIHLKTMIASERCPLEIWNPVASSSENDQ